MGARLKEMAKMAVKRLSSGFWQDENNRRKKTFAILQDKGADTREAHEFFVSSAKYQINNEYNKEDEDLYIKIKKIFLSGNTENALSALIDQDELNSLDESGKQRYIFNLSSKLQDFRERFDREQKYDLHAMSI